MQKTTSFQIYNASAGSGKTFTLVKEYLKLLFQSNRTDLFKNILALTFTNKAVSEMKSRILDKLTLFSSEAILKNDDDTFTAICKELSITPEDLHFKSKIILQNILHNYAAFDISTIDRFTHKVIRTFAFDLKIPVNFEVELDTDSLLSEAVDSLIAKAGGDKTLTKVLINFAIEKADEDKSWDIAFDFNKIAKLLVNENDIRPLDALKDKTLDDFNELKKILKSKITASEKAVVGKAEETLTLIEACGLQFEDFTRGSLPKHFQNLSNGKLDIKFNNNWQLDIENTPLYPKKVSAEIASVIDQIKPQLIEAFNTTKQQVFQYRFYKNFYKNITPLSVLNAIDLELKTIKEDKNLLLISEFNKTIHNEIKDQPTPFIYERLGEKFKHYFIDEFQDTSELQWENLIPLIDHSLSSETGSLMLVGDAKQSIYRWRGGKPELFIDLFNKESNPFHAKESIYDLPTNYRSCKTIVDFNNRFFEHLSSFVFKDEKHQELFKAAQQKQFLDNEGYVNLNFLEFNDGDHRDDLYPEAVKQAIDKALQHGFRLQDICVLVRKKKEGVAVADYLSSHGLDIISSETLLLSRSPKVHFIANVLKLSVQPENKELKAEVLYFIAETIRIEDKHRFIAKHIELPLDIISETLLKHHIDFSFDFIHTNALYNAAEYIIRQFYLIETSDAYIQFFLDIILEFSEKESSNILDFMSYWEKKKEQLSISIPQGQNAVQVMTIHKSKGLEFPVVIFPYADLDIYREREPKVWFPLEKGAFHDFSHTLLNYNKDMEAFGEAGEAIFNTKESQLELDNINLLYVTLTRPIEQLYIISKKDVDAKGNEKLSNFSGLFIHYLKSENLWLETTNEYHLGTQTKTVTYKSNKEASINQERFISNFNTSTIKIVTNSGYLWDTKQEEAIQKGNLIHHLMSKVNTENDIDFVLNDALVEGMIDQNQVNHLQDMLLKIVNHKQLKPYYNQTLKIYNERDIIASNGQIIRPDRLVVDHDNNAIIIDYKTGQFYPEHFQQLQSYQDIIETMDLNVIKKILIYINEDIDVKEL